MYKHNLLRMNLPSNTLITASPDGPPLNFEITVQGPRTLTFSWDPPSEDLRNGVITGYLLSCDPQPEGLPKMYNQSEGVNITIGGFEVHTNYTCIVSAFTSAGVGPNTTQTVTTLATGMKLTCLICPYTHLCYSPHCYSS